MTITLTNPIAGEVLCDLRKSSIPSRLESPSGDLPLVEVTAKTSIDGLIATTKYTQRFLNPTDEHLEVSYIFPLPARAGATDFVATLGGRRIEGILKERGAARADYAQALAESKRAALVEAERPDVFTARIGNIAPHEEAIISLVVTGPLAVEDGEATFRFPLVTAPRYITGTPLGTDPAGSGLSLDTDAVPDASRLNPPRLAPGDSRPELRFEISLVYPGVDVSTITTSHPMAVSTSAGAPALTLAEGAKLDADLLMRFYLPQELTANAVICEDPAPTKKGKGKSKEHEGTWAVTVVAPRSPSATPRDIVMVLDRSGSMGGWKMVAARRAAARLIDTLLPEDRFALIAFDDQLDVFSPASSDQPSGSLGFVSGTDRNRFAAVQWLANCNARGGTEMRKPLTGAIELLSATSTDREPVVVLVTDGQIGAEAQLLAAIEPRLGRTRFCVIGIDRAANTSLLTRLSSRTNGYVAFVESEDRLDAALITLHRRVGRPDLLSVAVTAEGLELVPDETSPSLAADVFAGVPRIITGRYRSTSDKAPTFSISAELADGSGTFTTNAPVLISSARGIADTWARARLADLEDAYDARRSDLGDLRARIIELSISSRVLSRFTAFLAVDHETQEIANSSEMTQPVESPDGWAMAGTALMPVSANFAGGSGSGSLLRGMMHTNTMGEGGLNATSVASMTAGSTLAGGTSVGSATAWGGTSPKVIKTLRSTHPAGAIVPQDTASSLLTECLEKLRRATPQRPARVSLLARRLARLQSSDPSILAVTAALYAYIAATSASNVATTKKALAEAIKVVEAALLSLPQATPMLPPYLDAQQASYQATPTTREFWT